MTDTVLIVDDEEPVRRTFEDWLREAGLAVRVFAAPDAETALKIANENPIDRTAAALNDPVPLPEAVKSLLRFAARTVGATGGALIMRHVAADGTEATAAYGKGGVLLPTSGVNFSRSLAASILSRQEPAILNESDLASSGFVELFPF